MDEISNSAFLKAIDRRRTSGIISHPDAGKTTLTEKLLLFGGSIRTASAVKPNKVTKTATSDFMEIEKQRGISVATSVMSFEYQGQLIDILDTQQDRGQIRPGRTGSPLRRCHPQHASTRCGPITLGATATTGTPKM